MPNHSPRWVPRVLQRYATLSPSAKMTIYGGLQVGEGRAVGSDRLLQSLGARRQARRDGIIYIVNSHELVYGGHVALIPSLLMESANQRFVFLFDRHRSLLLYLAYSPFSLGPTHEHDATWRSPS